MALNTSIRGAQIKEAFAGDGLTISGGVMSVNVDDSSIEITADVLNVKSGGITNDMLAGSIGDDKLAGTYVYADGTRPFTGTVSGVTPTEDAHLATKAYVDAFIDESELATLSGAIVSHLTSSGVIDHGYLIGLSDDDHTQYLLADGSRALSGDLKPNASSTVDLGSSALPYAEVYSDIVEFSLDPTSDGATRGLHTTGDVTGATAAGQALYLNSSGQWALAQANTDNTMPATAISTVSGSGSYRVLNQGFVRNDAWNWTPGGDIYVSSDTAGGLTQTTVTGTGDQVQVVGFAVSSTVMYFDPDYTLIELGDPPYYTKTELDGGQLDNRYYTETEVDALISGTNEFVELTDTPAAYAGNANYLLRVNGTPDAVIFESELTYDGNTFVIGGDLEAVNADFSGNVGVSGTFGFDTGTTVTEIATSMGGTGDDNTLLTEKAIYDYVNTVSGAMVHNELEGLQGGTVDEYYHLTSNEDSAFSSDGVTFTFTQALAGTSLDLSSTLDVAGNADFYGNVNISGTLGFDGGTAVDNIVTSMSEPGADTNLVTEQGIVEYVDTVSGALQTDIIWEIVDTPTTQIRPKVEHLSKAIYTEGNVTIGGDLTVTGTLFYADVQTVQVEDNIMVINYGEVGAGVTAGEAGIQVDRGSETDYLFVFDEGTDTFRIGVSGSQDAFNDTTLQPVATREDSPIDTRVAWWDDSSKTLRTQGDTYITVNSGTDTIVLAASDTTEMTVNTDGMSLKSGASVNEIVTSMSSAATDDQLATAQAIYEYVNTVSGAMVHNELEGLQGGNGVDEFYHLSATAYTALSGVDSTDVSHWDEAYSWGDHSLVGYLTTETDPVFGASAAAGITSGDITNWDAAYAHSTTTSGNPHNLDLDDVPDGTSYERVAASQLESGIYIDATTAIKGIASFDSGDFTVTSGAVSIKTDGVDEDQLNIANAPQDGYYLKYTSASGMQWTDVSVEGVLEDDYKLENESASCNGVTTDFTIDNAPVDNSLQVYLNGLLQEKGQDYTHNSGTTTISFAVAPLTNDILIIHYVKAS